MVTMKIEHERKRKTRREKMTMMKIILIQKRYWNDTNNNENTNENGNNNGNNNIKSNNYQNNNDNCNMIDNSNRNNHNVTPNLNHDAMVIRASERAKKHERMGVPNQHEQRQKKLILARQQARLTNLIKSKQPALSQCINSFAQDGFYSIHSGHGDNPEMNMSQLPLKKKINQ